MSYVRFVISMHGLRAAKPTGKKILRSLIHLSHPHIHLIQIHVADELQPPKGVAILPRLDAQQGAKMVFNLYAHTRRPYHSDLGRYKHGFQSNFGAFHGYYVMEPRDKLVTYARSTTRPPKWPELSCRVF